MMVVPGSGPPAGSAADSAGTTRPAADDHDRIAQNITEVTDVVVCRLYSTGPMLQTALQQPCRLGTSSNTLMSLLAAHKRRQRGDPPDTGRASA